MVNHMRRNRGQRGSRRAHDALKNISVSVCPNCSAPKLSHRICEKCGQYKGRMAVDVIAKVTKKEQKKKEKAAEAGK